MVGVEHREYCGLRVIKVTHVKTMPRGRGVTIPDNEKTGVDRACRYDPTVNRVYQDLADH